MDAEQELIACIAGGSRPFHEAVDALVSRLLCEVGFSHRATDGILLARETVEDGRATGAGIVVMIECRQVQPLQVEFMLDAARSRLTSGFLRFGSSDLPDARHGSQAHHKVVKQMLAGPALEFPWIERFHGDSRGWHREPSNSPHEQPGRDQHTRES